MINTKYFHNLRKHSGMSVAIEIELGHTKNLIQSKRMQHSISSLLIVPL